MSTLETVTGYQVPSWLLKLSGEAEAPGKPAVQQWLVKDLGLNQN